MKTSFDSLSKTANSFLKPERELTQRIDKVLQDINSPTIMNEFSRDDPYEILEVDPILLGYETLGLDYSKDGKSVCLAVPSAPYNARCWYPTTVPDLCAEHSVAEVEEAVTKLFALIERAIKKKAAENLDVPALRTVTAAPPAPPQVRR